MLGSNFKNITNLLNLFFVSSLIFIMIFFIADYFTLYYHLESDKFIFLDERRIFLEQNILKIFAVFFSILIISILFSVKSEANNFIHNNKMLIFFIITFIIYYLIFGGKIRGMFFFGILSTLFIYGILPFLIKVDKLKGDFINTKKIIVYSSLIYLILPLIIYITHLLITNEQYFQYNFFPQFYIVDSFRGISLDRIQYGFLTGIILLIIFFMKNMIKYNVLIIFILGTGLYLSMSRAVIVALICAIFFYIFKYYNIKFKKLFIYFIVFIVTIFILSRFSDRPELFSDGGNRMGLLILSFEKIFENGYISFLFGSGDFYTINHGHQPHNMLLQSIMNFGSFITTLYLIVIYDFFKSLTLKSKTLFIYIFIFGQFHVGFSVFLVMPITLFSFACIVLFNIEGEKNGNIIS